MSMICNPHCRNVASWANLPEDIWVDILDRLRLTDLAFVSQTCRHFNYVSRLLIKQHFRNTARFTARYEFSHHGVPIEPDIDPESGQAICFDETTNKLKVLHLPTGLVVASSSEAPCFPVSLKFSPNGNFVAACFDSKVCLYALDLSNKRLFSCLDVSFDVPILDFVPPGYGRCRDGMGRILASFSRNDSKLAVAHISECAESNRFLTFKCFTRTISTDGTVGSAAIDNLRFLQSRSDQSSVIAHLKVSREFVSHAKIRMNADPLRFLIPPGCVDDCGILFDPFKPSPCFCRSIKDHDETCGSLITYRFSGCGNYYIESRKKQDQTCTITILKYELDPESAPSVTEVSVCTYNINNILHVLISDDSNLAVILLGTITDNVSFVKAWYVANLSGGGYFYVHCKSPIYTEACHGFDLDCMFGLSYDGQLLSILCDYRESKRNFTANVFETATGRDIDALSCAVPDNGNIMDADWPSFGGSACYHVFGGRRKFSLTMFTIHDYGASFSHAS